MSKFNKCKKEWLKIRAVQENNYECWSTKRNRNFLESCAEADLNLDGRRRRGDMDFRIDPARLAVASRIKKSNGVSFRNQAMALGVSEKRFMNVVSEKKCKLDSVLADELLVYYGPGILWD